MRIAMYAATQTISADLLTPIGAYLALARPGEACLLESVEHGGRISRYSFIGLDYLAARTFEAGAQMLDEVRAFVRPFRPDGDEGSLGGALVAFAYDAARPFARLPRRKASAPEMPDAYVTIPGTWLIFDHFSDRLTIWASGHDA